MPTTNAYFEDYWEFLFGISNDQPNDTKLSIFVADSLPNTHSLMQLNRFDDSTFIAMTTDMAAKLSLSTASTQIDIDSALTIAQMHWYEPDDLFYLDEGEQRRLLNGTDSNNVRLLSTEDAELFEAFEKENSEEDLENAGVELDNDIVFGFISDGQLICVADCYSWKQSKLADIGVLTTAKWRGKGIATQVVQSLSRYALSHELGPQYRSQEANRSSIGVATKLGMKRYGSWRVAVPNE
ncbi:GNAT family N-acetyltransferase [Maritalea sp.]|uniref:GNAT family N-acetyltransferase n=1 Tax=Maritalea sp. TaxID=2003361 RepID=UPI003EF95E92